MLSRTICKAKVIVFNAHRPDIMTGFYKFSWYLALQACLFACNPVSVSGSKVIQVVDGDTLLVQHASGATESLELQFIDAPEREQPYGREAKMFLHSKVYDKYMHISEAGEIIVDGENINLAMIKTGFAWLPPKPMPYELQLAYSEAQSDAMNSAKGLWSQAHALRVPPWVWRDQGKQKKGNPMPQRTESHP